MPCNDEQDSEDEVHEYGLTHVGTRLSGVDMVVNLVEHDITEAVVAVMKARNASNAAAAAVSSEQPVLNRTIVPSTPLPPVATRAHSMPTLAGTKELKILPGTRLASCVFHK